MTTLSTPEKRLFSPDALFAVASSAHQTGDRLPVVTVRRVLREQYGIRLSPPRREKKKEEMAHAK
jgi:hypothetical protein